MITVFAIVLAWLALVAMAWLGWQLLRQNGRLLLRVEELESRLSEMEVGPDQEPQGLPMGSEAPAFDLPDLAGERMSLAAYRGHNVLVIFFDPACGFCRELVPQLGTKLEGAAASNGDFPKVLLVSTREAEANRNLFAEHKLRCPVLLQKEMEVTSAYQANGTPSGYLISPDGKIASGLTMGAEALLSLTAVNPGAGANGNGHGRADRFKNRSLAGSKIKRDGLKAGTTAPEFRLPRLDGQGSLALADLRGSRVLLVFSSPSCGPCNELAPQLEKLHREHPELEVVMISKGEPKENRAKVKEHGLTFPVVLQPQWEVSRQYAMFATPIAYLIDEAGVITHDVALGLEPIQALIAASVKEFAVNRNF